jgi:putative spermidine/putrescine transport system ATP-binding protein
MASDLNHGLSLRALSKRYGAVVAMADLTLDVAPGEFLSLLGPSGSGKTSILMAIAGFVRPDSGDILLDDTRINDLAPEKRNFGVVFQGYALFPHMSVRANVGYPLAVRGVPRSEIEQRVKRTLDLVQLGSLADRLPRELSGGQQQRVALARALVFEPSLVLLDEPLSALDKKLRGELQIELKALHARLRTTFIFVTHDQEEAMALSDRIVILREGRIVQIGGPAELYEQPANRFVAEFLGRANFFQGTVEVRDGATFTLKTANGAFTISAPSITPMPQFGQQATIAVRPERIRFANGTELSTGWNRLGGRVTSMSFMGLQRTYSIETAVGPIALSIPSFHHNTPQSIGSAVAIEWSAEAGILLRE